MTIFILFSVVFFCNVLLSGNIPVKKANYKLPARFSSTKLKTMVFNISVDAHWMKHSNRFWYSWETPEGKTYYILDPERPVKRPLFDNVKMAAQITKLTKDPYDAKHLPIEGLRFIKNDKIIYFKVKKNKNVLEAEKRAEQQKEKEKKDKDEVVDEKKKEKTEEQKEKTEEKKKEKEKSQFEKAKEEAQKYHHFEYEPETGKLVLLEGFVDEPTPPVWANISPDEKTIVFGRHFNLYYMDKENYEKWLKNPDDETIEEHQLTEDGEEFHSYYGNYFSDNYRETNVEKEKNKDKRKRVSAIWSQDLKNLPLSARISARLRIYGS